MNVIEKISADSLLGGRSVLPHPPRSGLEWVDVVRHGISSQALDAMLKSIGLSQAELAQALDIPERTLARRKREGVLSREESAKLLRLARVVARAAEVFEDLGTALAWLKTPVGALADATPLSLIDTDIGTESVMDTLGRIEHGVFA
ncbi:antitoxin Xre-like helix-turn-helix domain-containing protein [Burkholderia sp. SRS-W-2-2016]|uniref:type II RES/Xre toxin-antitoxin system antitoxin n=1 Tax=Burkholderia sp. SRS-W-2-2016 TaxID=1926878 RepID=UPI000A7EADF4|nr:antitoxin Xre-like helix-turn-helix domain-containing protein [Burkholderia sp. SRS-W-2-2016]